MKHPTFKEQFLARARAGKAEIQAIFDDCAYWNAHIRKPGDEPIDPDPDGALACALGYLDGVLNGDVYIREEGR